jgi:membrane protease YdiL (CAAX protease family)
MAHQANGVVRWLLRSSFAGILEGSVMLLTVRGRRTGRTLTFPVQYAEEDSTIWVLAGGHEGKTWWRNLVGERPVQLWLRGRELRGSAVALDGEGEPGLVDAGLRIYLHRFPSMARRLGVQGRDAETQDDGRHTLAKRTVMVRIRLIDRPKETSAVAVEVPAAQAAGPVGMVRRHPLGAFYLFTFVISWSYWIVDAIQGGHASHFPGLLGPMISAILVTGLTQGWAGLRDLGSRMIRWRVPLRWYLAAALPFGVALAAAGVLALMGVRFPGWAAFGRLSGLPGIGVVGVAALTLLINGFGEETGWRGFALPRFRRRHARLQASMLVAIPWIVWHAPTFFLDTGYRGSLNPLILPGFVIAMLAGSIVLTWIYEGAGASILLAAIWHTALNMGSATRAGEGLLAIVVSAVVIGWAFLIARSWHRQEAESKTLDAHAIS